MIPTRQERGWPDRVVVVDNDHLAPLNAHEELAELFPELEETDGKPLDYAG